MNVVFDATGPTNDRHNIFILLHHTHRARLIIFSPTNHYKIERRQKKMKFSIYTAAALVIGLATHGAADETASSAAAATTTTEAKDILVAAVGDMLDGGGDGVRGTNKTLAPTPGASRPPDTEPPVETPLSTPFPTEASVTTPAPVPDDDDTPSPTVRSIYIICVYTVGCEKIYIAILHCDCTHPFSSSCTCIAIYIYISLYMYN